MKRKSNDIHKLHGTYRRERHSNTKLLYPPAIGTAPKYLSRVARQEWNRIAPFLLEHGLLAETDLSTFASYCTAYAGWRECAALIEKDGQIVQVESSTRTGRTVKPIRNPAVTLMLDYQRAMLAAAAKFGFSPLDRERIEVTSEMPEEAEATDFEEDDDSDLLAR